MTAVDVKVFSHDCVSVFRFAGTLAVHPEDDAAAPLSSSSSQLQHLRAWDCAGVVSRAVVKAAAHLDALARFDWVGEDMLPDDRMWAELRAR